MNTNNSTVENNKLIAEFLGWRLGHPDLFELRWSNEWFYNGDKQTNKGYLHFHTDWNWLMQVVEKIESLNFVVQIHLGSCFIKSNEQFIAFKAKYISKSQGKNKIDNVYKAVIEFIKWYNENK